MIADEVSDQVRADLWWNALSVEHRKRLLFANVWQSASLAEMESEMRWDKILPSSRKKLLEARKRAAAAVERGPRE